MKEILEAHGERLKAVISDSLGPGGKTKFIITAGDLRVCPICQAAEKDGVIPIGQPYSNGHMDAPFHGKTCRCKQVTSDELASSLEVKADEKAVDVGIIEPAHAKAISIREYGSGNGPPNPAIRAEMDNIKEEVFSPLFNDLTENYRKQFLTR
jgi:hypothetical protein